MSEENKNPLIEAVLKLHEKMIGYGGKGDPYQGRSQQRFTNDSTTPDALRVKPSAPAVKSEPKKAAPAPAAKPKAAAPAPAAAAPIPTPKPEQPAKTITPTGNPNMLGIGADSVTPKSPMAGQGEPRPLPKSPMAGQGEPRPLPKSPMAGQGTATPPPSKPKPMLPRSETSAEASIATNPANRNLMYAGPIDPKAAANAGKPNIPSTVAKQHSPMPLSGLPGTAMSHNFSKDNGEVLADKSTKLQYNNGPIKKTNQTFMQQMTTRLAKHGSGKKSVSPEIKDVLNSIKIGEEMTNPLIDAFLALHATKSSNLFAEAKKAKKLDPVGKEDEDIDNDGDKDKSDSYLKNRREAISKAVKEAKDPYGELDAPKSGGKAPEMTTKPEYATQSKEQTPNRAAKTSLPKGVSVQKEEVEFSEAELAHIASIVEAVAPTPEDHASNATPENNATGGKGRGSMTEEDAVKRGRGRPKGSKSGSKHGGGGNAAGVTHLVDQIKHAGTRGIADGKGNYMLKHEHGTNKDGSPKVHTAAVPQKAANDFYKSYHNTEKPAAKQDLHDKFVAKHFGISKATTKPGISLASMPRPKS